MTHKDLLKLDGQAVTCTIQEKDITDGKIRVEEGHVYVCQNAKDGIDAKDKLGYKYSWEIIKYEDNGRGCKNIQLKNESYIVIEGKKIFLSEESINSIKDGLKEEKEIWYPESGESYYYIHYDGQIGRMSTPIEKDMIHERLNTFKTEEEAQQARKAITIYLAQVKYKEAYDNEYKPNWGGYDIKYYIGSRKGNGWQVEDVRSYRDLITVYFSSKEIVEGCLEYLKGLKLI